MHETSITYDNSIFRLYYLCHYLPLTTASDTLSRSLLKFKRGIQPDLDAWIECSLEVFHNIPLTPDTIIVRALHHGETKVQSTTSGLHSTPADPQDTPPGPRSITPAPRDTPPGPRSTTPDPLDLLGQTLAASFHCQYQPSLLCKSRPTLSNKGLTREQRQAELKDVYSITPEFLSPPSASPALLPSPASNPPFLLIDDIFTTGTTIRAIIHTLRRFFPLSPLQIFTLAKADHDPDINRSGPPHSQNYHLEEGTGWVAAEDPTPYPTKDPASYPAADQTPYPQTPPSDSTPPPDSAQTSRTPPSDSTQTSKPKNLLDDLKNSIRTNFK